METFKFKGYEYTVKQLGTKAEFNAIYEKLLDRANKGKSIVKDLEYAYRLGQGELYLIRFDQERHALVPVRIAKESVDGFLMKNRYDDKSRILQRGIGKEMSKHTSEIYDAVDKKREMREAQTRLTQEKLQAEKAKYRVDGKNLLERLEMHSKVARQIQEILDREDVNYRENRDYKFRIDSSFEKIRESQIETSRKIQEALAQPEVHISRVNHLIPSDVNKSDPPPGFYALLEIYLFLSVFNGNIDREWLTVRDYGLNTGDCPVIVQEKIAHIFSLIGNTSRLVNAIERILFPAKQGIRRDPGAAYDLSLFTEEVVKILSGD